VGTLLNKNGISLKIDNIDAAPGSELTIYYISRLKAIKDLQESFTVTDQGKDTGMLVLSLTGDDPKALEKILNTISNNYLAQNIAR
ncbi:tyrosine-protein kinase, partial [Klebsiella pneumoniae]|nr:tyrosine-protein kinase [Klebsiella pneumoniae]